jgi:hypothetical protein
VTATAEIDLAAKVAWLRRPGSFSDAPDAVEAIETHFAWVFLSKRFAYKLKKPLRIRDVDFTTLAARRASCELEVALNRRLTESVYIGIVPLAWRDTGFALEADGDAVEWLVKMRRLPREQMLDQTARQRAVTQADLEAMDTYDTDAAAARVVELTRRLPNKPIAAVRLDSGDLDLLARRVRTRFDEAGLSNIEIFASGNLDEHRIANLVERGAPIDGFGIGTSLDVSSDAPALDCAYKLQEYAGRPRRKRSTGKATWPGCKQVYRRRLESGEFGTDLLTLDTDPQPGEPLLKAVMRGGQVVAPVPLTTSREHARAQLAALPASLRALDRHANYRVEISRALITLTEQVDKEFR